MSECCADIIVKIGNISGNWNRITIDLHNRFAKALPSTPLFQYADPSLPVYFGQEEVFHRLCEMGITLRSIGVTHVMIACNTFHIRRQEFMKYTGLFMFDMVAAVKREVASFGIVAVISTAETIESRIYESSEYELIAPLPNEQSIITDLIIKNVKRLGNVDCDELIPIVQTLADRGAQIIIIGCTDLTLMLPQKAMNIIPVIDPMSCLISLAKTEVNKKSVASGCHLHTSKRFE